MNKEIYLDLMNSSKKGELFVRHLNRRMAMHEYIILFVATIIILAFAFSAMGLLINYVLDTHYLFTKTLFIVCLFLSILSLFIINKLDKEDVKKSEIDAEKRTKKMKAYFINKKDKSREAQAINTVLNILRDRKVITTYEKFECLVSKKDFKKLVEKEYKRIGKNSLKKNKKIKKLKKQKKQIVKDMLKEK